MRLYQLTYNNIDIFHTQIDKKLLSVYDMRAIEIKGYTFKQNGYLYNKHSTSTPITMIMDVESNSDNEIICKMLPILKGLIRNESINNILE